MFESKIPFLNINLIFRCENNVAMKNINSGTSFEWMATYNIVRNNSVVITGCVLGFWVSDKSRQTTNFAGALLTLEEYSA